MISPFRVEPEQNGAEEIDEYGDDLEGEEQLSSPFQNASERILFVQIGNDVAGPQHDGSRHGKEMHRGIRVEDRRQAARLQKAP